MPTKPRSAAAYFATLDSGQRALMERIQTLIRKTAPRATETFSYGMPAFRLDDRPLLWFAAWTDHTALYPLSSGMRASLGDSINGCDTGRGTIRFSARRPLPVTLIRRLIKARIEDLKENRS